MIKIKKLLAGLIIILLSFGPIVGPLVIYAEVTTEVDSGAVSGENQITVVEPSPSPDPSPLVEPAAESTPAAEITTGEAVSVTEAENNVNTTEVNSEVIFKTLNIFLNGDIDLTDTASLQAIVDQAITENPEATTISVSYDGTNIAYVANEILSVADSGNNSITNATDSAITTGDAYSIVSLLNQVNTTIINSQIYLVTINIFGDVNANIILPE
ncbi:MAG: hypothetical protein Q8P47_02710, partial [Candidatus Beckwithbacteria bacterium]|nr:hypothetical protein [Candidatus Beckwithbacteria bacterium]